MNRNNIEEVLEKVAASGVKFYIEDISGGSRDIEPKQVLSFIEDRNNFFAELYGVGVETIEADLAVAKINDV